MKAEKLSQENVPVKLHYRWVILGVCWMAFVVAYLQRLGIGPLAPFMKDDLKLTSSQTGLFSSAAALGYALTTIPAGRLVDKYGVRWILLIGEIIGGIFIICLFKATTFNQVLIFMGLAGTGMGCLSPATTKAVIQWFPARERATAMGAKQTAVNIGGMITGATLPAVAIRWGWNYGFLIIGIIALVLGGISFVTYRDPPQNAANQMQRKDKTRKVSIREVFRSRDIWFIVGAGLCLMVIEFSASAYFVLYLKEGLLFPVVTAGFFSAWMQGGGAVGKPLSGFVSDRFFGGMRKRVFIIMCILTAIMCEVFVLLPAGAAHGIIVVVAIIFGFAAIGWGGLQMTLTAEFAGPELAGTATGIVSAILMLGNVVGPPLFGRIVDINGYQAAWQVMVFLGVAATALLCFVRENRRRV